MPLRTTREVARLLNVPRYKIQYILDMGKIPTPRKNASGRREWTEAAIQQAKEILNGESGKAAQS